MTTENKKNTESILENETPKYTIDVISNREDPTQIFKGCENLSIRHVKPTYPQPIRQVYNLFKNNKFDYDDNIIKYSLSHLNLWVELSFKAKGIIGSSSSASCGVKDASKAKRKLFKLILCDFNDQPLTASDTTSTEDFVTGIASSSSSHPDATTKKTLTESLDHCVAEFLKAAENEETAIDMIFLGRRIDDNSSDDASSTLTTQKVVKLGTSPEDRLCGGLVFYLISGIAAARMVDSVFSQGIRTSLALPEHLEPLKNVHAFKKSLVTFSRDCATSSIEQKMKKTFTDEIVNKFKEEEIKEIIEKDKLYTGIIKNERLSTTVSSQRTQENIKGLRIGITVHLDDIKASIWTNGIKINILIFAEMLCASKNNYKVYLLNTAAGNAKINYESEKKGTSFEPFNVGSFDRLFLEMDMIVQMGSQVADIKIEDFKKVDPASKRVVAYKCGNSFLFSMENILFTNDTGPANIQIDRLHDEVWYVPQQNELNRGYFKTLYRQPSSFPVPFLWNPRLVKESCENVDKAHASGSYAKDSKYVPGKEKKSIGILEPNLNVCKFCMIPLLIAEESFRGEVGRKAIEKVKITNAAKIKEHREFMSIVKALDLYKEGKVSAESRYQTAFIISQHVDIAICHQLMLPLSYVYLDIAYMGYPVLHNAPFVRDLGYYYEGCDTVEGAKVLDDIIKHHDENLEEYRIRNEVALWRYRSDNPKVIKAYDQLILNLFRCQNENLNDYQYNFETNLIDPRL